MLKLNMNHIILFKLVNIECYFKNIYYCSNNKTNNNKNF